MIQIGDISVDLGDPLTQGTLAAAAILILFLILLIAAVRAAARSARNVEEVAQQVGRMNQDVAVLGQGQQQLAGTLQSVSETQTSAQLKVIQTVESRLAEVQLQTSERLAENARRAAHALSEMQERMRETLHGSSEKTMQSLTQLQERLATIDKAQTNIEKLSGDVLSLQDILSNKQTRGAFGEIQLNDIVSKALPSDAYALQPTLSNGSRPDCLIHLPNPPGPIVIDAKFPLEDYERYVNAEGKEAQLRALKVFGAAVRTHIKAIAEKYLIEGETADGALMFLPSEAVYAELHARLPEVVREGFAARVWIVSPTTCMATLNTMRAILKDARMREQAGAIRKELALLHGDVDRLGTRVENLDRHFSMASKDIAEIKLSANKAGRRAQRLDSFDFEELAPEDGDARVVPLRSPDS